jgi:hypothetical protein
MSATTTTGKTCDLRQQCEICLKWYGRKIMTGKSRGAGFFEGMTHFKKKRTCSKKCGYELQGRTPHARCEARAQAEIDVKDAYARFV